MRYLSLLKRDVQTLIHKHFRLVSWKVIKRFRETVTVDTCMGRFTVLCTDEAIGAALYSQREFELGFMQSALSLLRDNNLCPPRGRGTVVDVGANNGVISIGMLVLGEVAQAIAIEPEPKNYVLLNKNVAQNHLGDRVTTLNYAATDFVGDLQFELSDCNSGDHRVRVTNVERSTEEQYRESSRPVITIAAEPLDNLISRLPIEKTKEICLIWIDIQGHEGYAFRGAKELLARKIPVVTELWPYGLRRAGMKESEFHAITKEYWSHYWVSRRGKFIKYPIDMLESFMDELGAEGDYENIILTS